MPSWLDLATAKQPSYHLDRSFYEEIRAAKLRHKLVDKFVIAPRSGRGFHVNKGQAFRIMEETGPQIGAAAFWNAHDPRESFIAGRTMAADACFIHQYTQLWSDVPWFRPMVTCLEDTVVTTSSNGIFHHHFVGTHCSPETQQMRFGVSGLNACRPNLLRAIESFGLGEKDLHDNVTVHQKTRLDPKTGRIYLAPSDGKPGDYIEFYAEMDLLVAVSVCPLGDGLANPTVHAEHAVRPLRVEIYDTGIAPKAFPAWTDWRPTWTGRWVPPER